MRCELVSGGSFLLLFFSRCMWRICNLSNMSIRTATSLKKNDPYTLMRGCVVFSRYAYGMAVVGLILFYIHLFSADGCVRTKWCFFVSTVLGVSAFRSFNILLFSVHFIYHFEHRFFFLLLVVALCSLVLIVSHSIYLGACVTCSSWGCQTAWQRRVWTGMTTTIIRTMQEINEIIFDDTFYSFAMCDVWWAMVFPHQRWYISV